MLQHVQATYVSYDRFAVLEIREKNKQEIK